MADEIRVDYDRMEQVASQFANQSQAIQQMLQKVRGSMDPLESGGWVGRGSDAFFSEMQSEVLPATERLQQALDEASRVTKQIVQTVRQAEEEACSPFRTH
ncbi:MAG TPA: WXG100 family type VII secretion target [Anaerolineae bacterium]|nr:WXG100 family type VII secretion target [Anaerolineae bacterium]HIP73576.1 WXG100 family type VII secretion target [Anaerolineae bacterium]